MSLIAALIAASAFWWNLAGIIPPETDISERPIGIFGMVAYAIPGPTCQVVVDPWWESFPDDLKVRAIEHELGHCLGLGHFGNGLMGIMGGDVTMYDVIAAQETQGVRRVFLTMPIEGESE